MFRRLCLLLATAALVLAACGGGGSETRSAGSGAPGTATAGGGSEPGLLDFQATTVSGTNLDMSSYAGGDLVVWFWAPW